MDADPDPDPLHRRDRARPAGHARASRPDTVPGAARLVERGLRVDLHRTKRRAVTAWMAAGIAAIGIVPVPRLGSAQPVSRFDGDYNLPGRPMFAGWCAGISTPSMA